MSTNSKAPRRSVRKTGGPKRGSHERTGTVVPTRDGRLQPMIRLADRSKTRLEPLPKGTSRDEASGIALLNQKDADRQNLRRPERKAAVVTSDGCERWVELWLRHREAKGYTSVREDESHWANHARHVLALKHPRDWTRADLRALRLDLVEKARGGTSRGRRSRTSGPRFRACARMHRSTTIPRSGSAPTTPLPCGCALPSRTRTSNGPGSSSTRRSFSRSSAARTCRSGGASSSPWPSTRTCARASSASSAGPTWIRASDDPRPQGPRQAETRRGQDDQGARGPRDPHRARLAPTAQGHAQGTRRPGHRRVPLRTRHGPRAPPMAEKAGVDRAALHEASDTSQPIRFHDLRSTGCTWAAIRNDPPLQIQARAGHKDFQTTQGYIRTAEAVPAGLRHPLPGAAYGAEWLTQAAHRLASMRNLAGRTGLEPAASGVTGRRYNQLNYRPERWPVWIP